MSLAAPMDGVVDALTGCGHGGRAASGGRSGWVNLYEPHRCLRRIMCPPRLSREPGPQGRSPVELCHWCACRLGEIVFLALGSGTPGGA